MTKVVRAGNWIATVGALIFVLVLFVSAYAEPDIRWLHFFQSWMYFATIILIWRKNKWGYFVGIGAAAFWGYANVFVTTFLKSGLDQTLTLMHTGHLPRPDLFISVPAWLGNLFVICGCVLAYNGLSEKRGTDLIRLGVATAGTTRFFALIMALCQPRYLAIFSGILHPHLHL